MIERSCLLAGLSRATLHRFFAAEIKVLTNYIREALKHMHAGAWQAAGRWLASFVFAGLFVWWLSRQAGPPMTRAELGVWVLGSTLVFSFAVAFAPWVLSKLPVWKSLVAGETLRADPATQVARATLSDDQRAFRIALKQFSLTHPQKLMNGVGRVRGALVKKIKEAGDKDYSFALHHAMHFAWSSTNRYLQGLTEAASLSIETMDVDAVQLLLRNFFDEYIWDQKSIANLNVLAKVDLRELPELEKWLDADKAAIAELDKLKVWPEAQKLKKITEDHMATPRINWSTPFRVNF